MYITCIKNVRILLLCLGVLVCVPNQLWAETDEDVDYVGLAERLYADGHLVRAEQTLKRVDPTQEGVDLKAYHLISGLVALQRRSYPAAAKSLQKAIDNGENRSLVYLGLAQAHFHQKDYEASLVALKTSTPAYGGIAAGYLMAGQCYWSLDKKSNALAVLDAAHRQFPAKVGPQRQKVLYLVELGLYHEAIVASDSLMRHPSVKEEDFIAVAHALRSAKQPFQVIALLEQARIYRPNSHKLKLLLAHAYHDANKPYSAGLIFESLAIKEMKYAFEAAQAFKMAKRFVRALSQNAKVPNVEKRFKQRLAILVEDGRFFEVAAMEKTLSRLGLLDDDELRYAIAYAHFKSAAGKKAKHHLNQIEDMRLLEQVSALRRSIATCEESGCKCL